MSEIQKIFEVMKSDVGYLEKASNKSLDSKTANAGYRNITKFWRDTTKRGRMKGYGYDVNSGFVGGADWPYCACGIDDAFCRALGTKRASELLLHGSNAFINCETMYRKAKAANHLKSSPSVGTIVLFKNSSGVHYHTEWCYKVTGDIMYTIGYNTSNGAQVVANGGGVCYKQYRIASTRADYYMPDYDVHDTDIPAPDTSATTILLKIGSSGEAVKQMQTLLERLGYDIGRCGVDGDFGYATRNALVAFQNDAKIVPDGIYGKISDEALKTAYKAKYEVADKNIRLYTGVCVPDRLKVRSLPGDEYPLLVGYPYLNKGNQVDVMKYTAYDKNGDLWRYIRIANKYFGYVPNKSIRKE